MEQITPDVNLPGLKQKGKEAEAIGKGGAEGDGAADQVCLLEGFLVFCNFSLSLLIGCPMYTSNIGKDMSTLSI